jgi:export-related chaperone CsaA
MPVSINDFSKIEIRVGKVLTVEDIPQARNPMYRLQIDLGDGVTKQCVAGIKSYYTKEQLQGRQLAVVVNLEPKSVAGVISECMLLCAFNDTDLSLLKPDKEMPPGTKIG